MSLLAQIREKAAVKGKTIVLPEGTGGETLQAIKGIIDNKIANPILLWRERDSAGSQNRCRHFLEPK